MVSGGLTPVDEFWIQKVAEAIEAGGSIVVDLDEIPHTPGSNAAWELPSVRVGQKLVFSSAGEDHRGTNAMRMSLG